MSLNLPTQTIRVCDGTPIPKPVKRSGANARKQRVESTAEAPVEIKAAKPKTVRKPIGALLRAMVLERDRFRCVRCGEPASRGATLHVDHIVPVAQWGDRPGVNDESNLQTLCSTCNAGKGARREPIDNSKIVKQLAALVGKGKKSVRGINSIK